MKCKVVQVGRKGFGFAETADGKKVFIHLAAYRIPETRSYPKPAARFSSCKNLYLDFNHSLHLQKIWLEDFPANVGDHLVVTNHKEDEGRLTATSWCKEETYNKVQAELDKLESVHLRVTANVVAAISGKAFSPVVKVYDFGSVEAFRSKFNRSDFAFGDLNAKWQDSGTGHKLKRWVTVEYFDFLNESWEPLKRDYR